MPCPSKKMLRKYIYLYPFFLPWIECWRIRALGNVMQHAPYLWIKKQVGNYNFDKLYDGEFTWMGNKNCQKRSVYWHARALLVALKCLKTQIGRLTDIFNDSIRICEAFPHFSLFALIFQFGRFNTISSFGQHQGRKNKTQRSAKNPH